MKLGVPNNGESLAGSVSNTSSAAPPMWPDSSPSLSAASSIRPPRAQFTIRTPCFVLARFSRLRMLRVWSVSGVCKVMKSARRSRSSSSTFSMPSSTARSGVRNGSKATTFIRRPSARLATIEPMLPAPIRPSVLPVTSTPMKRFFSHLPACVDASASGSWRASANIKAMACSAVVIELPNGVFMTTTPALGRRGNVDIVDTNAGAADNLQVGRRSQDVLGDLGRRADGEAVVVADDRLQLLGCLAGDLVDLDAALAEDLGGAGVHLVADENFRLSHCVFLGGFRERRNPIFLGDELGPCLRRSTELLRSCELLRRPSRATARALRCPRCRRSRRTRCEGPAEHRDTRRCRRPRLPSRAGQRRP